MAKNLETYGRTSDGRMIALLMYKEVDDIEQRLNSYVEKIRQIGPIAVI